MKIKINKTTNYTVMSNIHLRDKRLTLKAKGLLSMMFSLPEKWDYSIRGITSLCKEKETSVKSCLDELKETGYLVITKYLPNETESGRIEYQYDIYEQPLQKSADEFSKQEGKKQGVENLGVEILGVENQVQINKEELNKEKSNKEQYVLPPTPSKKTLPVRKQDGGSTEEQIELMADMLSNTPDELPKIIALLRWALCQLDFQTLFAFVADYSVMGGKGYEAFKETLLNLLGEQK